MATAFRARQTQAGLEPASLSERLFESPKIFVEIATFASSAPLVGQPEAVLNRAAGRGDYLPSSDHSLALTDMATEGAAGAAS